MNIHVMGTKLFHADGWANMMKLIIAFCNFVNMLEKLNWKDIQPLMSIIIIIIIGIQPLGWSGQRPEFSQALGMALVRCILGKFLGVACHCFPPLFRSIWIKLKGHSTCDVYLNRFVKSSFVFVLFGFRHLYTVVSNPTMDLVPVISYMVCTV